MKINRKDNKLFIEPESGYNYPVEITPARQADVNHTRAFQILDKRFYLSENEATTIGEKRLTWGNADKFTQTMTEKQWENESKGLTQINGDAIGNLDSGVYVDMTFPGYTDAWREYRAAWRGQYRFGGFAFTTRLIIRLSNALLPVISLHLAHQTWLRNEGTPLGRMPTTELAWMLSTGLIGIIGAAVIITEVWSEQTPAEAVISYVTDLLTRKTVWAIGGLAALYFYGWRGSLYTLGGMAVRFGLENVFGSAQFSTAEIKSALRASNGDPKAAAAMLSPLRV
jgi:hypothetical protein